MKKILIVEDNRLTAKVTEKYLKGCGYSISGIVDSGEEVMNNIENNTPDLVLMDIELKGRMDGIEAAEKIKSYADIPVLYITSHSEEEILLRAKRTEPFGYLIKPFGKRELNSNIEMALHKHKAEMERLKKEELEATMVMAIAVNHEINNPLTAVVGGIEHLQSEKDMSKEEKEDILNTVHRQAIRISEVVKQFTEITKPVRKQYCGNVEMIDLEKSSYN